MEETTKPAEDQSAEDKPVEPPVEPPAHYSEETVETSHSISIGGKDLKYTATAGRMLLKEEDGKKRASFFFVAYTADDRNPEDRPIVFAFNGGPGSSSVWLHFGALGPKRVDLDPEGRPTSLPGRLVENPESWLDAADLVFIDPVGTGFSRAIPGDKGKEFHHFTRDIEAVAEFIRGYVARHGRWASPKYLAGESYGTMRSAGLATHVFDKYGLVFNGLILISTILNYGTGPFDPKSWTFRPGHDLPYSLFLPTYAAAAWYHGKLPEDLAEQPLRAVLDEVEEFARTDYTVALMAGDQLPTDQFEEVAERVARYTGLRPEYVRRYGLRIEILRFCKELLREDGKTVGRLDARVTGPAGRFPDADMITSDPSGDLLTGTFAAMANDYVKRELEYESDLPYNILSLEVHQAWDYEDFKGSFVDTSEGLRETMSRNPGMRVFVASGYYDLATPHFAAEYTFSHMRLDPEIRPNVEMGYYEAGHMMYAHEPSRKQLAADARGFIKRTS